MHGLNARVMTMTTLGARLMTARATSSLLPITSLPEAPGLFLWQGFAERPDDLFAQAWSIADAAVVQAAESKAAQISDPHRNKQETFLPLVLEWLSPDDDAVRPLRCEHFATYGEGHELTYFRGTRNLPTPIMPLVEKLEALPAVREEVLAQRTMRGRPLEAPFEWRLTLNRYPANAATRTRTGFPWHRDIEANGASTMILGLNAPGRLQFAEKPDPADKLDGMYYDNAKPVPCVDLTLPSGDLLVLTGKARWDMLHRVVAEVEGDGDGAGQRARISLVLGCS